MKNNNIKKSVAAVVAILVTAGVSQLFASNADITLSAYDTNYFADASGNYLNDGDLVEMGVFSINNLSLSNLVNGGQITAANYATLLSDFIPLNDISTSTIGTGITSGDAPPPNFGAIATDFYGNNTAFNGSNIFIMVFNSNTTGNATQVGVFTGNNTWVYPASMTSPGAGATIDADQAFPIIGTYVYPISGSANTVNTDVNNNPQIGSLELDKIVTIPEPSTMALVAVGILGAFAVRRRKHV